MSKHAAFAYTAVRTLGLVQDSTDLAKTSNINVALRFKVLFVKDGLLEYDKQHHVLVLSFVVEW